MDPSQKRIAARRVRVPRPIPEGPENHPVFWVECFGCTQQHPQLLGASGKARLPDGWVILYREGRTSKAENPDVYSSPECLARSVARLAYKEKIERTEVVVVQTLP